MSELEDENKKLDKYRYVAEHQGGSYGSVEPIILRVRKTPNAYTVMYHTFDDEFYFLKGGTKEYDRVLVYRTAYFICKLGDDEFTGCHRGDIGGTGTDPE